MTFNTDYTHYTSSHFKGSLIAASITPLLYSKIILAFSPRKNKLTFFFPDKEKQHC